MRTLKVWALYFTSVFAAGCVFGPIRELWVVPYFGRTAGLLFEAPSVVMITAARWTIRHLAGSSAFKTRATVGLVALGMLLISEVISARWLRGLSIADYLQAFARFPGRSRYCSSFFSQRCPRWSRDGDGVSAGSGALPPQVRRLQYGVSKQ